ncbi:MAG: lipase family protein, partial [Solirubrobacteraceae bacterium]
MSLERSRRPGRRSLFSIVAIALLGLVPAAAQAADPAFYTPPDPLPAGTHGSLIRSEPMQFYGLTKPPAGTTGYRMLYQSTTATGQPVAVSGALLLPPGEDPDRPIVSVGVGNHGLGDSCAPSRLLSNGAEPDLRTMVDLLGRGYAVAVTDDQGLGTPGNAIFGVNTALGYNVLDAIRAARQVPGTGLPQGGPTAVIGYSEGGGAAGAAAEEESTYTPELHLKGVVAGDALADPGSASKYLNGNLFFGVVLQAAVGYDTAYPELDLGSFLNVAGKFLLKYPVMCQQIVPLFTMQRISFYAKHNPLLSADWQARLEQNQLGHHAPVAPVYLYYGQLDEVLSWHQGGGTRRMWCAAGANVKWSMKPLDHFTSQLVQEPGAIDWLADRI